MGGNGGLCSGARFVGFLLIALGIPPTFWLTGVRVNLTGLAGPLPLTLAVSTLGLGPALTLLFFGSDAGEPSAGSNTPSSGSSFSGLLAFRAGPFLCVT